MKQLLFTLLMLAHWTTPWAQSANTQLSNLVAPTAINVDLLPNSTNARSLGSPAKGWKSLYLTGNVLSNGRLFLHNKGTGNTFLGDSAGRAVTKGNYNAAVGYRALFLDTSGSNNAAVGAFALQKNTNGYSNTAVGSGALQQNATGFYNTATGAAALQMNTTGKQNTASGVSALTSNSTGYDNVAIGFRALAYNTSGYQNVALGTNTLFANTTGYWNVAIGIRALKDNTTARDNIAIGRDAYPTNTTGHQNTALGSATGSYNITGSNNTNIGFNAGYNQTMYCTFLGAYSRSPADLSNSTALGFSTPLTASNQVRIGSSSVTSIGGQVGWTSLSDGRFKKNVAQGVHGLDFINSLTPVTYTLDIQGLNAYYNKGRVLSEEEKLVNESSLLKEAAEKASRIVYNGFVAQEVEEAAKKLKYEFSGIDKPQTEGGLYGLRYSEFVVPLVKAVQELSKENEEQKKEIAELRRMVLELKNGSGGTVNTSAAYLEQSAPNPARGAATIRYHVPDGSASVRLTLTNAKGQLLKTLSITGRGTGQLNLDTAALPAGVYNYSLWVDGREADTKQMVVSR